MDKRRFFSRLYFVLLTCLLILPWSKDVSSAEWEAYYETDDMLFSYDAEIINFLPNNIIRVWIKMIPKSEEARVRNIQFMRNANMNVPNNWGHELNLDEINCKNKTMRVIKRTLYSIKDELIKSYTTKNSSPDYITPETMEEELSTRVCGKKDTKENGR